MVQPKEEIKAKAKARRSTPEFKKKLKEYESTPEFKARRREYRKTPKRKAWEKQYRKKYEATPEYKAQKKEYDSRPEVKARKKILKGSPEYKAKAKVYSQKPEVKAKAKKYAQSFEAKEKVKEYLARPEVKAKTKARQSQPEYRKKLSKIRKDIRLKVLQHYSKHLSNSDIPCCNCCGENFHIDFLAVDHIAGKKQMDSEPELVKLGYSSKLEGGHLQSWIKKNNFPKGFQILCHNCNFAKGIPGNKNKCPHETKRLEETFAMMEEQSSFEV